MKKKFAILLIAATFIIALAQPSTSDAEEMYPKITRVQPVTFVALNN